MRGDLGRLEELACILGASWLVASTSTDGEWEHRLRVAVRPTRHGAALVLGGLGLGDEPPEVRAFFDLRFPATLDGARLRRRRIGRASVVRLDVARGE